MSFFLFNSLLVLIIIFLLIILSMIWPPDSPWAPWWRTNRKTAMAMCKLAKISKYDIVYDLGCGDGTTVVTASKLGAQGIGIEIDPLRFWIAVLLAYFSGVSKKAIFKRGDFFKQDISDATIVFVYLVPNALKRLKPKLLTELAPGTKVVSYRYTMDLPLVARDKKNNLYLYQIP